MKKLFFLFPVLILGLARNAKAETGVSIGLKGTYNVPLGKFSKIDQGFLAGQKGAKPGLGFGGKVKYHTNFFPASFAFFANIEFLQFDDQRNEIVSVSESGDTLGTTDFKFRIVPITVAIQYSPFSGYSNIKPYVGLGMGTYFYSYVNTGYEPRSFSFKQNYTRFGLNLILGNELTIYRHWTLDVNLNYHFVFLHNKDTIGLQGDIATLRFLQAGTGILYNF